MTRLPGVRGPSLRRRLALALGAMFVIGFFVIAFAWNTISYMAATPFSGYCYGATFPNSFPALTSNQSGCSSQLAGVISGAVAVVVIVGLATSGCWLLASRLLRPLSATAQAVSRFGPHNLGERIRLDGSIDPLKELTDALDDALDRLAAGYESQRRFAANASHELRTPLAVQRLLTEVAMEDPGAGENLRKLGLQLLRTNERNEQLIEGLLALAESDRGIQGRVPVRLDELAGRVLDAQAALAETAGITVRRKLAAILVPGDEVLLERLVANLVSNAVKYNEPGGWLELEVAADPALTVRNSGDQVPTEAVPALFEPFRRLGSDRVQGRGGVGLGLAIVRSIVIAHEGTIQARPLPDGGLELEIALLTRTVRAPAAVGRAGGPDDQFRK
jgi:signal transduction histidine kinase